MNPGCGDILPLSISLPFFSSHGSFSTFHSDISFFNLQSHYRVSISPSLDNALIRCHGNGRLDPDARPAKTSSRGRRKPQASCSSVCHRPSVLIKSDPLTQSVLRRCDGCRRVKEKCEGGVPCRRCLRYRRQCNFTHIDPNEKTRSTSVS